MTAVLFALLVALQEASACPRPIDAHKLNRMLTWSVRREMPGVQADNYQTRRRLIDLGQHAARYACRKEAGKASDSRAR